MERGDETIARVAFDEDSKSLANDVGSRVRTAWAHLGRSRGDDAGAREARDAARRLATSGPDACSTAAMRAMQMSRASADEVPWREIEEEVRMSVDGGTADVDGMRVALAGARAVCALTRFRNEDALESAMHCEAILRGISIEALEAAKSAPHGWAIATAMKALGHVERLRGSTGRSTELYERASEYAADIVANEHPGAMASRIIAEDVAVDCSLALAQAHAASGDVEKAEEHAARAVSGCEALGDERHPRVGVAIAASGDVYVAKALRGMTAQAGQGDGAGVMFAEGLYLSALKLMHYPHAVEDARAASLDHEARHLCAVLHARYSSILRASGAHRAREADKWLASARLLWPDESGRDEGGLDGGAVVTRAATKLGVKNGGIIVLDTQQMVPYTMFPAPSETTK